MTFEEFYYLTKPKGYGEFPYNPDHKPLITFLICCRVNDIKEFQFPDQKYNNSTEVHNLYTLLDSFKRIHNYHRLQDVEFIIKFDTDNDLALDEYLLHNELGRRFTELVIRPIIFNRWEGKNSLYLNYMYLFSKRNPASNFIGFLSDDCIFYNKILQQLDNFIKEKYVLLTTKNKKIDEDKGSTLFPFAGADGTIDYINDYKNESLKWRDGNLTEPYPIISTRLLESMGNLGWQIHIDSSFTLLTIILKRKYGLDIRRWIDGWCMRGDKRTSSNYETNFNKNWVMSIDTVPSPNDYIWDLYETAARNIYLNAREDFS